MRTTLSVLFFSCGSAVAIACGSAPAPPLAPTAPEPAATSVAPAETTASDATKEMPVEAIYERIKSDLLSCYAQGKKAAPKMNAGKLTLHAAIEKDGRVSCVIPADDTGLTQEVEDCMSARLAKEGFDAGGAAWTFELPLVVKADKLALGEDDALTADILTVETHGLDDKATDVAEKLLPKFQQCVVGIDKGQTMRVLHVGGRVGGDGAVTCAIATSPTPLAPEARACAADALRAARFAPPKKGNGLVSIPLKLMARRAK